MPTTATAGEGLKRHSEHYRAMSSKTLLLLLFGLAVLSAPGRAVPPPPDPILELAREGDREWLGERDVVFLAEDMMSGLRYGLQRERIDQRHVPFSSFKIPNLLIALETGVADDLDFEIDFDPVRRPPQDYWPEDWRQKQTLRSAFQRSAAWYFQDLAIRIGAPAYRGYLKHFGYGNADVPLGSDTFWLNGPLKVSPREQTQFLRQLLVGQLEVSPTSVEALREASLLKEHRGWKLHAKTGAGPVVPGAFGGPFEGWFVGWIDRPDRQPVVFALWTEAPSYEALKEFRREATERLLKRAGLMPAEF